MFLCARERREGETEHAQKDEYYALKVVRWPFWTKLTQLELETKKAVLLVNGNNRNNKDIFSVQSFKLDHLH